MSRASSAAAALLLGCSARDGADPSRSGLEQSRGAAAPAITASAPPSRSTPPADCPLPTASAEGAVRAATALRAEWMPKAPEVPADVVCCIALEMRRSASVERAWAGLDARKAAPPSDAIAAIAEQGAACSLVTLLFHADVDVDIQAARALASVKEATHPVAFPFLLESAERLAVAVGGSEEATLHGVLHDALTESLISLTSVHVKHRSGQDPEALHEGIPPWREAIDARPPDAITDARGATVPVLPEDRTCATDDACGAVAADCSNLRCVGVRADKLSTYDRPLDCSGYKGMVGNYDCLPRFHIESPRCEAGRCSSRRVPK